LDIKKSIGLPEKKLCLVTEFGEIYQDQISKFPSIELLYKSIISENQFSKYGPLADVPQLP